MKPIKRILWVYSRETDNQLVLDLATTLAKESDVKVTVIEVIEGLPRNVRGMIAIWRPLFLEQPEESLVREETERLVESVRFLREHGIQGDTKILVGATGREIVSEILRDDYDLVVLNEDHKGDWRDRPLRSSIISRLFGGSIVGEVVRWSYCPVLIVPPPHPATETPALAQGGAEGMTCDCTANNNCPI